ncbi:hypothetical protein J2X46_001576 [Nocardioides sp. BE266]|uniref:hypothetical protein n=1 Tax=Nocardioides sp. BE266 TaxID=2817725 RepID=UPI00285C5C5D|nr:hypothetical protein [Nocardioides sp. BE266]MDR7252600.1 hypothetical protein [Nocardioides sp. BE266]
MSDDDELMARLSRIAAEVDSPPDLVAEAARAAFVTRRLDAELAELVSDSDREASAVRGSGPRTLAFRWEGADLELQLEPSSGGLEVRGLVAGPSGPVLVVVDTPATSREVESDDLGWFSLADVPAGPVRVTVRTEPGEVSTGWIRT